MQQFKIALILVVCGLYATFVAGDDCSVDGYFANPDDTGKYYQCFRGRRFNYQCAQNAYANYVFVDAGHGCIDPQSKSLIQQQPAFITGPATAPKPLYYSSAMTYTCPKGDGTYTAEDDCRKYYICYNDNRSNYDCGAGYKSSNNTITPCAAAAEGECY